MLIVLLITAKWIPLQITLKPAPSSWSSPWRAHCTAPSRGRCRWSCCGWDRSGCPAPTHPAAVGLWPAQISRSSRIPSELLPQVPWEHFICNSSTNFCHYRNGMFLLIRVHSITRKLECNFIRLRGLWTLWNFTDVSRLSQLMNPDLIWTLNP